MNILIACEESQTVCKAFREKGHNAYSADLQMCSGGHPEWHVMGDVLPILNPTNTGIFINTADEERHFISHWDMIIAHPPCTYLTKASATRLFPGGILDKQRYQLGLQAKEFFLACLNASAKYICVENPTPLKIFNLPPPSMVVEPWEYGSFYRKRTLLWLKNLPYLMPLFSDCEEIQCWVSSSKKGKASTAKARSKTFPEIAAAMANTWCNLEGLYTATTAPSEHRTER